MSDLPAPSSRLLKLLPQERSGVVAPFRAVEHPRPWHFREQGPGGGLDAAQPFLGGKRALALLGQLGLRIDQ